MKISEIQKDVPIPVPSQPKLGGKWVNLLRSMEPGDYVELTDILNIIAARSSIFNAAKSNGMEIVTRIRENTLCLWRTK